ncbi:GDP-fucose protein O-fucosyltransferase [Rhizoctonia solani]|uniref:GDP-fucose protein O-fucosyltransferase n=1 Tax=Rhizoctonia solani TaxID=456999 RepID=A0A8H7M7J7_9AGAM|nr:GDP-fucose protein O-fucosyltransferase [Rhizoctonia solani]
MTMTTSSEDDSKSPHHLILYFGLDSYQTPSNQNKLVFGITLMGTLYIGFTIQDSPSSTGISVRSGTHLQNALGNNSEFLINHTATSRFQDNLSKLPEHKFITAWPSSGWTNDVISAIYLIYIASLTGRIPIIPPFTPSHVGSISEVGPLEFGDVFDVSRLANELGMHILEWREVKNSALDTHLAKGSIQPEVEKIGCWSTWALSSFSNGQPRYSDVPGLYNLDISYTPVPDSFTLSGGSKKGQYYLSLWSLASLAYRATREWAYGVQSSRTLPLTSGTANEEEWWKDYAPYWPKIGVHLHWTSQLLELAQGYLRRHFKVKDGEPIPPFISVHVRRADFAGWCPSNMSREACFATPDDYAKRVREVQASLRLQSTPIDVRSVLVTSDERDPGWWEEMAEFGPEWGWVDHKAEGTVEKYGKWYPVVLDAVFQSLGTGFVGTDRSTMSLLSQRRVESWNNGVASLVKWGSPNADAH